jgi:hypothetical protein
MIQIIPNVLSKQECQQIIDDLDPENLTVDVSYTDGSYDNIKKYPFGIKYIRDNKINNNLGYATYPLVEDLLTRIPNIGDLVSCTIVYYPPNSRNQYHCDSGKVTIRGNDRTYERFNNWNYTAIIFLNDQFDGGELIYPEQGCNITPTVGTMVISPAGPDYMHLVNPVSDKRFVLVYRFI